jgi:hypothetical protein
MKKNLFAVALFAVAGAVHAAPVLTLDVNTSSLAGTTGALEFEFNPNGPTSQPATAVLFNLTGGTLVSTPQFTGDVSGVALPPGPLSINNTDPVNEFFQPFTFGSMVAFSVQIFGSTPNGTAVDGSTFDFLVFSNSTGTAPALTSNGLVATVQLNANGSVTATTLTPSASFGLTPEPSSVVLLGSGLAALAFWRKSRRRNATNS